MTRRSFTSSSDGIAGFANLDPALERRNLTIEADTPVDRIEIASGRVSAAVCAGGRRFVGDTVILAAGTSSRQHRHVLRTTNL